MRRGRRLGGRGLAEIVGTLMLVLIVVAAAVAFSLFVASYQKQVQSQEAFQHQKSLEHISVISLDPVANPSSPPSKGTWHTLIFTVASLDVNNIVITGMSLNSNTINGTKLLPNGTIVTFGGGSPAFTLSPHTEDTFEVYFDLNLSGQSSFGNGLSPFVLNVTSVLRLDVFTSYLNDFTYEFGPPTANAAFDEMQVWDSSLSTPNYVPVPLLDASNSFQSGNLSIVTWNWTITGAEYPNGTAHVPYYYAGEKVLCYACSVFDSHPGSILITLSIADEDGLPGYAAPINYTIPLPPP